MGNWIKLEDKLPEGNADVLVYREKTGDMLTCHYDGRIFRIIGIECLFITHWQPLPDEPQD